MSMCISLLYFAYLLFFFFYDPATPQIYTLSLHDALPISSCLAARKLLRSNSAGSARSGKNRLCAATSKPWMFMSRKGSLRSEEHTSELQSHSDLVCRLLLEKKKNARTYDEQGQNTNTRRL